MDKMLLRVFQTHVADQCRIALAGVPTMNRAASAGDHNALWIGCQMFVVGSGNVSKAFWGDGKNRPKVAPLRQPLRDSLGVTDNSPLYPLALRNNFEHFDERIDRWWKESPGHNVLDKVIGPPNMVQGMKEVEMFRIYDPTGENGPRLVMWGQSFDLQPIASECDRLLPIAEAEAAKPHWGVP